jgi:hypothetical protein
MRFMSMVKSSEKCGMPPQELMDAIGKLGEEGFRSGTLVEVGGLAPTDNGARVKVAGGKLSVTDGPFSEAKEVIGGYAVYEVPPGRCDRDDQGVHGAAPAALARLGG